MEEGFLLDEKRDGRGVARWIAGAPERSFWTGIKLSGRNQFEVTSYRCRQCGYLESYANE
jgi:hypothetical protein